jgi:hypothetical protein
MRDMTEPVSLDRLREEVSRFGSSPYVLTVNGTGGPHAVSTAVSWEGDGLVTAVGARTSANASERSLVSLLWPPFEPGGYSLIVDATAELDGELLRLRPTKAVLHRTAASGFEPSSASCGSDCIPILRQ